MTQLVAEDFRNLREVSWSPGEGAHLLLGENGAGKTSLLEAIYVIATTRSFRSSQIADCAQLSSSQASGNRESIRGGFRLQAEVVNTQRVGLELGWREGHGWRSVNHRQSSLGEYLEILPIVAWTAADTEIFLGPPEARRRFLDRGVVARRPAALKALARYRRVLRHKRELLWRRQHGLEAWNQVLAQAAAEVIALRDGYVEDLRSAFREALVVSGLGYPAVDLVYRPSPADGREGASAIEQALDKASEAERGQGRPLSGPHRDQLQIHWRGQDLGRVASAGERKGVGLLLLAAQSAILGRTSRTPVCLLDDGDSELDNATMVRLWEVLASQLQIFVSSNRPEIWRNLEITHRWKVEGGSLANLATGGAS